MHAAELPVGSAAEALPTRAQGLNSQHPSRMRKRRDFLAANSGARFVTPSFILLVKPGVSEEVRAGFTVSRKVGDAVARNRAKRRLREVVRRTFADGAVPGADHVLIARAQPFEVPFDRLLADARSALAKARRKLTIAL